MIATSTIAGYSPSDEVRADYIASYAGENFADAIAYVQASPEQLPALGALLPGIHTPVRLIQGSEDQVAPAVNATYLGERLPDSKVDFITGGGHFVWEECPDDCGALVIDWWNHAASLTASRKPVAQRDVSFRSASAEELPGSALKTIICWPPE